MSTVRPLTNVMPQAPFVINSYYETCGQNPNIVLFDGGDTYSNQTFYWYDPTYYLDITIESDSCIWAYSSETYPNYSGDLLAYKWDGLSFVFYTKQSRSRSNIAYTWTKIFDELPAGRYKFVLTAWGNNTSGGNPYRIDGEWYIENIIVAKHLLKAKNAYNQDEYYTYAPTSWIANDKDIVPTMTSNAQDGYVLESSSAYGGCPAYAAFNADYAGNGWISNTPAGWLRVQLPYARVITGYGLRRGTYDNTNACNRSPKTWTFEGSKNGTEWVVLDTQTNVVPPASGILSKYAFQNTTAYLYYRINITANNGDSLTEIGEMELYDSVPVYDFMSIGAAPPTEATYLSQGFSRDLLPKITQAMFDTLNLSEVLTYVGSPTYTPKVVFEEAPYGTISTTDTTSVLLNKYSGINNITINGYGGKYAVSFDGGQTWLIPTITSYTIPQTQINLMPAMGSNVNGTITLTEDPIAYYPAWQMFDRNDSTYYEIYSSVQGSVTIDFGVRTAISGYSLKAHSNGYYPTAWTLQGFNGTSWDIIDQYADETAWSGQTKAITFTNAVCYSKYKIAITNAQGGSIVIVEMQLFKADVEYGWVTIPEADIPLLGALRKEINDVTPTQWAKVFKPTQLDIQAYLSGGSTSATISSAISNGVTLSNNNLTAMQASSTAYAKVAPGKSEGKWYWEFTASGDCSYMMVGISNEAGTTYSTSGTALIYYSNGTKYINGSAYGFTSALTKNDVIGFALDMNSKVLDVYVNGVYKGTLLSGFAWNTVHPTIGSGSSSLQYGTFNLGTAPFTYKPPSGYLSYVSSNDFISTINISLPPNSAPAVSNFTITPTTMHNENVQLNFSAIDPEFASIQHQISVNDEVIVPWITSGLNQSINIPSYVFKLGSNTVKLEVKDDEDASYSTTAYVTMINNPPVKVSSTLQGIRLAACLGDDDSDQIRYRIFLNGVEKLPWSTYQPSPLNIVYILDRHDVKFGEQNTVRVEFEDILKGVGSFEESFVGSYYGLLFTDEVGDFYSTDAGIVLKRLEMGTWIAGQTSIPQTIRILNTTGVPLQQIRLTVDTSSLAPNTYVTLSHDVPDFENLDTLYITDTLNNGDFTTFQVRIHSDLNATGGGIFKIRAVGIPV